MREEKREKNVLCYSCVSWGGGGGQGWKRDERRDEWDEGKGRDEMKARSGNSPMLSGHVQLRSLTA